MLIVFSVLTGAALLVSGARAQADESDAGWKKGKQKAPAKPAPTSTDKTPDSKEKLKQEGRELFNAPRSGDEPQGGPHGWAVTIAAFKGEGHEQAAAHTLQKIRTEGGLPEAYTAKRRDSIIIAVGDFAGPEDEKARKELARVQNLEISGVKPYAAAMLAPPLDFQMAGALPQFNLARAKEIHGEHALYTLQVGAYGRLDLKNPTAKDLKEARRAAEEAASKLRQEGETAWYFHGPTMSMVTVGVFDTEDFDPQVPTYNSPKLRETKKRNPLNLYNGAGIKVKIKGQQEQLESSRLVEIPKS